MHGWDPMRHLVMYSRVGRTKVFYAVSFTDLGQVLQVTPLDTISPVTYLPRTSVTLFIFYYYSFYTLRILKNWRSYTSYLEPF